MKICDHPNCGFPVFSGTKCSYHYRAKPIKRRSDKRAADEREYTKVRKEFIQELRDSNPSGSIYCMFCGKKIYEEPVVHHTLGRKEELLLDTEWWIPAHHECHMEYHNKSWKLIEWWNTYLSHMKQIMFVVWEKEILKMSK